MLKSPNDNKNKIYWSWLLQKINNIIFFFPFSWARDITDWTVDNFQCNLNLNDFSFDVEILVKSLGIERMFESGVDLDFDLFDLDCTIFEEDSPLDLLDLGNSPSEFYELKSKNVVEPHVT